MPQRVDRTRADGCDRRSRAPAPGAVRNECPRGKRSRIRGIPGTSRDGARRRRRASSAPARATSSGRSARAANPSRPASAGRSGTTPGTVRSARNRTTGRIRPRRAPGRDAARQPFPVSRHPPSKSPDETSGVENSRRIEGGLEPAHQLERAGGRLIEKFQMRSQRRRGREQPQMPMRGVRRGAPSSERLARLYRVQARRR